MSSHSFAQRRVGDVRQVLAVEQIGETPRVGEIDDLVQPRPPKVGIYQQDALLPLGRCDSEVSDDGGLSLHHVDTRYRQNPAVRRFRSRTTVETGAEHDRRQGSSKRLG